MVATLLLMPLRCPWARPQSQTAAEDTSPGDGCLRCRWKRTTPQVYRLQIFSFWLLTQVIWQGIYCIYLLLYSFWNALVFMKICRNRVRVPQEHPKKMRLYVGRQNDWRQSIENNDSLLRHNVCVCVGALSCVCHAVQEKKKKKNAAGSWVMVAKNKLPAVHGGNQSNGKVISLTNGVKAKREYCCYVRNSTGSRSNGPAYQREENIVLGFRIMMQFPYILLGSIILLLSSSVFFPFFSNCLQDQAATNTESSKTCRTSWRESQVYLRWNKTS